MRYVDLKNQNANLQRQCESLEREAFHWAADAARGRWKAAAIGCAAGFGASLLLAVGLRLAGLA